MSEIGSGDTHACVVAFATHVTIGPRIDVPAGASAVAAAGVAGIGEKGSRLGFV